MDTPDNNQNREDEALAAPPELVAALKRLPQAPVFIPPTADEAVLRAARKQLSLNAAGTECADPRCSLHASARPAVAGSVPSPPPEERVRERRPLVPGTGLPAQDEQLLRTPLGCQPSIRAVDLLSPTLSSSGGEGVTAGLRQRDAREEPRPRAQQAPSHRARQEVLWPSWLGALLRPGTGALRWLPWMTAAAAAFVLLVAIPELFKRPAPAPASDSAFARWDLNHDGRVDILDAFALARQVKQGGARNLQWDVNGDGVVDERDVAAIAARAVELDRGGHS